MSFLRTVKWSWRTQLYSKISCSESTPAWFNYSKKSIYHRWVYGDVINYEEKIKFNTSYLLHKAIICQLPFRKHTSSSPVFSGVHVALSLVLCVVLGKSLFVLLFFFLCCLSFFDLWIPITHLVSSNSSYQLWLTCWFAVENFLMICGIALPLNTRDITLGISESYIDNQNTINHILLILKCYIF